MTNRMDYIHRKSRGRALNESMLNEAVYNIKDVREMWYRKIKLLSDPRKQINLHAKLSKIEPGLRDAELARILLHNFPGTSPGFINSMIGSTFGDPDWLEILNTRFGTNIDMDYLKSCFTRMRGPELDQRTLQAVGKKEDAFIKQIESGRGNTKSEEVMKVAASTKRTYIAGSFEEVYELVTTRNDFEGRYEKNPDGTISINMADIPLTMVRAMYGLRAVDDSQPLVYIVFGPNGGNDKVIRDHAKQELDLFLRNSHEEKELQEMRIGYYDLRPCGLEYWWTNVSKRFVSKKDNEAVDKVRNSNATLILSRGGECALATDGFESEPEIDPAVNPGNAPVTAPIEDEYGFDSVKESKNNDIRMNRYNRNWTKPESSRLRRFADMLESVDDTRYSKKLNETSAMPMTAYKVSDPEFFKQISATGLEADSGRPIFDIVEYESTRSNGDKVYTSLGRGFCLADGRIRVDKNDLYTHNITLSYYTIPEFLRKYKNCEVWVKYYIYSIEDNNRDNITLSSEEYRKWDTNKNSRKGRQTFLDPYKAMRKTALDDRWDRWQEEREPIYAESFRPSRKYNPLPEVKALTPEDNRYLRESFNGGCFYLIYQKWISEFGKTLYHKLLDYSTNKAEIQEKYNSLIKYLISKGVKDTETIKIVEVPYTQKVWDLLEYINYNQYDENLSEEFAELDDIIEEYNQQEEYESYNSFDHTRLYEAKALTPEEKMDRWHNGIRKENIKACNIDKLKEYRKICRAKGYTEQVKIINAELKRRKDEGINESLTVDEMLTVRKALRILDSRL